MRFVEAGRGAEALPARLGRRPPPTPGMLSRTRNWWEFRILFERPGRRRGRARSASSSSSATAGPRATPSTGTSRSGRTASRTPSSRWSRPSRSTAVRPPSSGATSSTSTGRRGSTASLLPVDHPLWWLLATPRRMRSAFGDGLWVRLVDVGAALSARGYAADGAVVLDVVDDFCPWNAGRWRVADGRAKRTTAAPQLRLRRERARLRLPRRVRVLRARPRRPGRGAPPRRRRARRRDVRGRARAVVSRDLLVHRNSWRVRSPDAALNELSGRRGRRARPLARS